MLEFSARWTSGARMYSSGARLLVSSTAPQLRGLEWSWEGGPYIEARLTGHSWASLVNVWDYKTDTARLAFTREALEEYLAEHYSDPDTLEALLEEIAQS